jgi:hypothetical protein
VTGCPDGAVIVLGVMEDMGASLHPLVEGATGGEVALQPPLALAAISLGIVPVSHPVFAINGTSQRNLFNTKKL